MAGSSFRFGEAKKDHGAVLFRRCDTCDIGRLLIGGCTRWQLAEDRSRPNPMRSCGRARFEDDLRAVAASPQPNACKKQHSTRNQLTSQS